MHASTAAADPAKAAGHSRLRPALRALALMALLCGHAAWAQGHGDGSWDGRYRYSANYGKTAGGSAMGVDYQITLAGSACRITLDGFQTEETLLCQAVPDGPRLTLRFVSHCDGAPTNAYGVRVYQSGQPLLMLERPGKQPLRTTWLGLRGLDGKTPKPGHTFDQ